ncbi:MAG: polynucleotide adenylyltransferase [Clostridia bacterium]|nr:polynucleotide adenylyltransferase [Clostridia bacterium]
MTENFKIRYNIPLPAEVEFVIDRLRSHGYEAFAVGGAVRDHVMGREPGDYDVTTSATPDEMLSVFEGERVVETGLKHGTLTVVKNGMNIETTTYRIDGSYADGRHPDSVEFTSSLTEDLRRRDFTINAMAYSPEGYLVDVFGGKEDIEKRQIRCVGLARERFTEDGLRILRALRFASVLGFSPDEECRDAVRELTPLLERISRERIYVEVTKLLCGKNAAEVVREFAGVLSFAMPPLTEAGVRASANAIEALHAMRSRFPDVRYAALLESVDCRGAAEVMTSLKPSAEEKKNVLALVKVRGMKIETEYDVLCLMRDHGDEFPHKFAALEYATGRIDLERATWICEFALTAVREKRIRRVSQLPVSGADMIALGLRGEEIGARLRELLDEAMRRGDREE